MEATDASTVNVNAITVTQSVMLQAMNTTYARDLYIINIKAEMHAEYRDYYMIQVWAQTFHITYLLLLSPWYSQLVYMLKPNCNARPSRDALINEWFSIKK